MLIPQTLVQDPGGNFTLISDQLLAAPASTIQFEGIPPNYAGLYVLFNVRGTPANTVDQGFLRFNDDTGANYYWQYLDGIGSTAAAGEGLASNELEFCEYPCANSPSGAAAAVELTIPNYASTAFQKSFVSQCFSPRDQTTGTLRVVTVGGVWASTAAIQKILFMPDSGNFDTGTRATLYGVG